MSGKTVCDEFAGLAMAGILANGYKSAPVGGIHSTADPKAVAKAAYAYANAMLDERNRLIQEASSGEPVKFI